MPGSIVSDRDAIVHDHSSLMGRKQGSMLTEKLLKENQELYLSVTTLNPFFNAMATESVDPKTIMSFVHQHRLHTRIGFIKLLGKTLAKITTMDERNFPHEGDSFDLLCEAVGTIHQLTEFLGHLLLELEDENEIGVSDISFGGQGKTDDASTYFTPENWSSVDFLLAAASDATPSECLIIVWALAQLYHDAWGMVKEKMIAQGSLPDPEASHPPTPPSENTNTTLPISDPVIDNKASLLNLWGSDLSPTKKLVAHWTSHAFSNFTGRLATNVQGYVDIGVLDEKVAAKLFRRTIELESQVWPKM